MKPQLVKDAGVKYCGSIERNLSLTGYFSSSIKAQKSRPFNSPAGNHISYTEAKDY